MDNDENQDHSEPIIARIGVPAWGLPSWNVQSLELLFLLHFNGITHIVQYEPYGYVSSTGSLPACEPGNGSILTVEESIFQYAGQLDNANRLENTLAYRLLCETKLFPLCDYVLFETDHNFNRIVYGLFRSLPFPFCAYIPRKLRTKFRNRLASTSTLTQDQRIAECQAVLHACESKLETDGTPFLLGSNPSSSDAALCAFVMFARNCPVELPSLKDMISPALSEYTDSVLKAYPDIIKEFQKIPSPHRYGSINYNNTTHHNEHVQRPKQEEKELSAEEIARQRGNRIAIGFAAATFFGFILFGNLIRFK